MPEPVRSSQRYLPGLDGLRALAVGAVVAYHLGSGWAKGGLLGVGVFFTLSGYLITDLLLGQQEATGGLRLADFWLRRARRLLPALFVMMAVVVAWVTLLDRSQLAAVRGTVAAAAFYVSNWWLIAQHSSYFAQFGPPSPVGHLWSLALAAVARAARQARQARAIGHPRGAGRGVAAAGRGLGGDDGAAVPARIRSDAGVRRHGHPCVRAADRRGAGLRLAEQAAAPRGRGGRPAGPRRGGDRRARRLRRAGVAQQRVLAVPLPRRDGPALARHGADGGRRRLTGQQVRPRARLAAAALAGRALLRHLPVALPHHRADHPGRRPGRPGPRRRPDRGERRMRGGELAVR